MPTLNAPGDTPPNPNPQRCSEDIAAVEVEGIARPTPVESSHPRTPPPQEHRHLRTQPSSPISPTGSEFMEVLLSKSWSDLLGWESAESANFDADMDAEDAADAGDAEGELEPLSFSATAPMATLVPSRPPLAGPAEPASLPAIPDDERFRPPLAPRSALPAVNRVGPVPNVTWLVLPSAKSFSLPIRPAGPPVATSSTPVQPGVSPLPANPAVTGVVPPSAATISLPNRPALPPMATLVSAPVHRFAIDSGAQGLRGTSRMSRLQLIRFVKRWQEGVATATAGMRRVKEEMEDVVETVETAEEERPSRRRRIEVAEEEDNVPSPVSARRAWARRAAFAAFGAPNPHRFPNR